MNKPLITPHGTKDDITFLQEKIKSHTPPQTEHDYLLLEIYGQILEKHRGRDIVEYPGCAGR